MATQGMVSVLKGKQVIAKVVCGCNGKKARELAKAIVMHLDGANHVLLRAAAERVGFGCEACLGIAVRDKRYRGITVCIGGSVDKDAETSPDALVARYAKTLGDMRFNPRWGCGIASHVWVANLDTRKAYGVGSYKGKPIE